MLCIYYENILFNFFKMIFRNEHNEIFDHTYAEATEQDQANTYITHDCIVLELGARYGTVSCIINKKLSNPNNQVSVEPDERIWNALERNMKDNECDFHIFKGFISSKPLGLIQLDSYDGYGTTSCEVLDSSIAHITLDEIQKNII